MPRVQGGKVRGVRVLLPGSYRRGIISRNYIVHSTSSPRSASEGLSLASACGLTSRSSPGPDADRILFRRI
jgi:hypothetical protein